MDVIATHENADFDGIASLVAVRHLYPGAVAVCPALLDRSVREYVGLHRDELALIEGEAIALGDVSRLVVVDTADLTRLGRLAAVADHDAVEIVVFDHHVAGPETPPVDLGVASRDGALITTVLGVLNERSIEVSPAEATLFALGIHQDTGSLRYESTTARDAEALAFCYRRGADLAAVERYTRLPLGDPERELLHRLLGAMELIDVRGTTVHVASLACESFPEGAAQVVNKLADLTEARALVVLLEHQGKTSCVVRSRGSGLDAAALARQLGGGGHRHAAAATLRSGLMQARARVEAALADAVQVDGQACELMSAPARFVSAETSVREAMVMCRRVHVGGLLVGSVTDLQGVVSREDLDGALAHGLGHAPVLAVMSAQPTTVSPEASASEVARLLSQPRIDRIAVISRGEVVGVVTRRDVLGEGAPQPGSVVDTGIGRTIDLLALVPSLSPILDAIDGLEADHGRTFLVGGGVRDALLGVGVVDIDISVEGAGVEFARDLADRLGGRATPYGEFGTATVTFDQQALDVATTRSEFYAEPGALPAVQRAAIESDLFRRDFTINAMAVALEPAARRGQLIDPYGGERDLASGKLRVLHNLSFVDDPTRLIRAARYEARYGFALDARSESLARACVNLGLLASLSGPRVGNELMLLVREENGVAALERLASLGVLRELSPRLDADADAYSVMRQVESLSAELNTGAAVWRLRFAILARGFESSDRYRWLESLQLQRRDVEAISRSAAVPSLLASGSEKATSAVELYTLLSAEPVEAVLLALSEQTPDSRAYQALRRFLTELRHVRLAIDGDDLAVLGLAESPAVGQVLDAVLALKLEGELTTREDEFAAARRLIRSREPA